MCRCAQKRVQENGGAEIAAFLAKYLVEPYHGCMRLRFPLGE